ncbi:uncharacterized protein BDR25DRAFT_226630 [Lindgomyces ingoldianus]|uniref:Uncharacterized protein n=1 Tax=Lindgomyces ingoldianus TaxID=673940 RepID=A0ACB6QTD8_9PLEO|nr:uncharacterized protein BDR25DRAFT_226630 [Lindgomyces ingoldianus]KAF2470206.1 hypothetical protein BDR25DRAFT_226630 [Lindgomyces ingoldianus]
MSASDSFADHCRPSLTHPANSDIHTHAHAHAHAQPLDHLVPASRLSSQRNSPYPPTESYFEEAFAAYPPSSPPPSFLDNILNPADQSFLPFGYRQRDSTPRQRPQSPVLPSIPDPSSNHMPPTRSSRLPNGYVDLTNDTNSISPAEHILRRSRRRTPTPGPSGPSTKRLKRNNGTSTSTSASAGKSAPAPAARIQEIDLSNEKVPIQEVLQRQRAEAVKAQQKPEEKATTFNTFNCVICMDTPTDITATSCGHLFCHTCLMEALIAGENRSGPNEPKRSRCPVCRKLIVRTKTSDIIPLLMKKGLATQPRKSSAASTLKEI